MKPRLLIFTLAIACGADTVRPKFDDGGPPNNDGVQGTDAPEGTLDQPFVDSDGACVRATGRRIDGECATHSASYCVHDAVCTRHDSFVIAPDGTCWHQEHDCGVPDDWTITDTPCVEGARTLDYCEAGRPNFPNPNASNDPGEEQQRCAATHPSRCYEAGCDATFVRRLDVERGCTEWSGHVACHYPPFAACTKSNDAGAFVMAIDSDGACYRTKVSCLPDDWRIVSEGECAEYALDLPSPCE